MLQEHLVQIAGPAAQAATCEASVIMNPVYEDDGGSLQAPPSTPHPMPTQADEQPDMSLRIRNVISSEEQGAMELSNMPGKNLTCLGDMQETEFNSTPTASAPASSSRGKDGKDDSVVAAGPKKDKKDRQSPDQKISVQTPSRSGRLRSESAGLKKTLQADVTKKNE